MTLGKFSIYQVQAYSTKPTPGSLLSHSQTQRQALRDQLKTIMANQSDLDSTLTVTVLLMRACK